MTQIKNRNDLDLEGCGIKFPNCTQKTIIKTNFLLAIMMY